MLRVLTAFLICAAAQAATQTTTLSVNATVTAGASGFTVTGPATFTGQFAATGTFNSTIPLTALGGSGPNVPVTYTITNSSGSLGGILQVPLTVLEGSSTSATGSGTITSATGTYAGDTGTFPSISGSGGVGATGITLTLSGNGTITTGGTVTAPPPTISAVVDGASYTANIAEGSIFVVRGTNLCATGLTQLSYPLPTSSTQASITFTPVAGGTGTSPFLINTYNENGFSQITAVLPSTLAVGNYNVTVTYNGSTSASVAVQVVKQKPEIFSEDESGGGLGIMQNIISVSQYDINRLTTGSINGYTVSPAKPGETIVIYATGLGPVPGGDNIAQSAYNFLTNGVTLTATVGGTSVTAVYAGRAPGFSGFDQIDITLPAGISTGCTVVLQLVEGSSTSGAVTISIAPSASQSVCVQAGYTSQQLTALDNGGTIDSGAFPMSQSTFAIPGTGTLTTATITGGFSQLTGFELPSVATGGSSTVSTTTIGNCTVFQSTFAGTSVSQTPSAGGISTGLDAGAVTLSGPAASDLSKTVLTETSGLYNYTIGETGISIPNTPTGVLAAGTYTLVAPGGTGVTGFTTSITLGSPLTINGGLPTTVVRNSGLPLTWTGGNATDTVTIEGFSGMASGSGASQVTTATVFICTTTAGAGGDTISSQVLNLLPATAATAAGGTGYLSVSSGPAPVQFSTTLTATPSTTVTAAFSASVGTAALSTYQ